MGIQVCLIVSRQISPQGQTMRVCSSEELRKKKTLKRSRLCRPQLGC